MTLQVTNIIHSTIAAFHNDGLLVFAELEKNYQQHQKITLSFEGVERCATQFLNASIGKMYLQYEPVVVDSLIAYDFGHLQNLASKIEEVRENAIHSKEYDSLLENAAAY